MLGRVVGIRRGSRDNSSPQSSEHSESETEPTPSELRKATKLGMVVDMSENTWVGGLIPTLETPRFPYSRPEFMYLVSEDEIQVSGDQSTRPVLVPKDPMQMPLYAGYAESINAGKTRHNEDQASAKILHLAQNTSKDRKIRDATPLVGRKSTGGRKRADSDCPVSEIEKGEEATEEGGLGPLGRRRLSDDDFLLHIADPRSSGTQVFNGMSFLINDRRRNWY